ncbi:MAG TPA: DUF5995 family protein [Polyangiales bacterium]|nr:DUF5995 family protein [Polyangiales bacterium]
MGLIDIVSAPPCRNYAEVLARLQAVNDALPADDGLRWFGALYADMTAAVARHAHANRFLEPRFLEALDCTFAELYFAALASFLRDEDSAPGAWYPLFERRFARDVAPLQFAVAGVNAHINRDLPVALVATFEQFALAPTRAGEHYVDYRAVDQILAVVHAEVKTRLITGLLAAGDVALGPVDDAIELWSLEHARESAWRTAELRWHVRDIDFLAEQQLATLDGLVGLASRGILRPGLALLA